jgi:predicted TIM-barrel fold metal-dependent hydrolase
MRIVDAHCHPYNVDDEAWGIPPFKVDRLLDMLDGPYHLDGEEVSIDQAIVQPMPGTTCWQKGMATGQEAIDNYMAYNREIIAEYPDRLIGNFIYNPRFGVEEGVQEFRRHVEDHNHQVLKLHAALHNYKPERSEDWLHPVFEAAADLDVTVMAHTGDPPYSNPAQFYPLAETFPEVDLIIAHFGVQSGASYMYDAAHMARKLDNVYVETGWAHQTRLVEFVDRMGPENFIFATDSPPHEPGVWLKMVENLMLEPPQGMGLDREGLQKILYDNIAELVDLPDPS